MKFGFNVSRLLVLATLFAKYYTIVYTITQAISGVGTKPPTWYYYPILIFLAFAISRLQRTFERMTHYYYLKLKESTNEPGA